MFAAQEKYQHDLGVYTVFAVGFGSIMQVLQPLLFVSAQSNQRHGDFHTPGQAAHDVIVRPHHKLRIHVIRIEFQNMLMVVPRANGISQRRKPCPLNQRRKNRKLGAGYAPSVEYVHIFRIYFKLLFLEFFRSLHHYLDLFFGIWICGPMGLSNKAVIGVLARVHGSHAIKFADHQGRDQVIYGKRIVGVPLQDLPKFLYRKIVVEIVKMIEGCNVESIIRSNGSRTKIFSIVRLCSYADGETS